MAQGMLALLRRVKHRLRQEAKQRRIINSSLLIQKRLKITRVNQDQQSSKSRAEERADLEDQQI